MVWNTWPVITEIFCCNCVNTHHHIKITISKSLVGELELEILLIPKPLWHILSDLHPYILHFWDSSVRTFKICFLKAFSGHFWPPRWQPFVQPIRAASLLSQQPQNEKYWDKNMKLGIGFKLLLLPFRHNNSGR